MEGGPMNEELQFMLNGEKTSKQREIIFLHIGNNFWLRTKRKEKNFRKKCLDYDKSCDIAEFCKLVPW